MVNERATKAFLWLAVLVGGPLLGAKLFDLVVLAGAWSANPPHSRAANGSELRLVVLWPVTRACFCLMNRSPISM